MKNSRIGGAVVMVLGLAIYFFTGENLETIAGVLFGAGFALVILSFLKRGKES